jgi:hypothetical protein
MKTQDFFATTSCPNTLAGRLRTVCAVRLLLLLLTLPALVQAQDYTYTTNDDNTISITGYTGSGGDVAIPNTIDGLPVTSIEYAAFAGCTSLTNITIPNSVTSIGDAAFDYCTSLTNAMIGTNVTNIGDWAFYHCISLTIVTIPNRVTNIGDEAFYGCRSLTNVTIPNSVTSIGDEAFAVCISLTSVMIPNSVTDIGNYAFYGCTSLGAITVDAFNPAYCSVGGVLFNKSQTTLIKYPAGKSESNYTIPNSVTSIGNRAFDYCRSLSHVTIPNNVTSIGFETFAGCYSMNSVTIPNSVTNIGDEAFYYCTSLSNVTIGNSVTSIGDKAFYYCTNLTGVYFQGNAPTIGLGVFSVGERHDNATVYYLPGTTGWKDFSQLAGLPTVLWNAQAQTGHMNFGVWTNCFGFNIIGTSNLVVVVEACTNLANLIWSPVETNTLTGGSCYFSDCQWTNYPVRCYRLRSP